MEIKTYVKESTTVTLVTLLKGERHVFSCGNFTSRGPGHVITQETPADDQWVEFNLGDEKFLKAEDRLKENGFKLIHHMY